MTFHFPEEVATNLLTIDAVDPVSGTAEFKGGGDPHRAAGPTRDRPASPPEISEFAEKG